MGEALITRRGNGVGGGAEIRSGTIAGAASTNTFTISGFDREPQAFYMFPIQGSGSVSACAFIGYGVVSVVYENGVCTAYITDFDQDDQGYVSCCVGYYESATFTYSNGSVTLTLPIVYNFHSPEFKYAYVWY